MHIAHLSFRHFPRLLALFRPFSWYFNIAWHASNKCLLPIFLSVTFLTLPAFTYIACLHSNECLLLIFLSVTFLAFLALFPPIFTTHLNLAGNYLINAYCPSFFPSLSHPSRPFSALFPVVFYPFSSLFPASFKVSRACF
jgi:hypothetical protein